MFGIVLVTHGAIGKEMLEALNQIVGPQEQAKAIAIASDDDMEVCRKAILSSIRDVNSGEGVVILSDMFGGTPSNLALAAMPATKAIVLAGINLPALVKLAALRAEGAALLTAATEAAASGRKYIQLVTENLAPSTDG